MEDARNTFVVDALAGAVGGVAAVGLGQPLDTVKVKMQLFPRVYGGMFECLRITMRHQGVRGLYAGTWPAIATNCLDNSLLFGAYGLCQKAVASVSGGTQDQTERLTYLQNAAAGGLTSIFTSSVICPLELVKTRMQGVTGFKNPNSTGDETKRCGRPSTWSTISSVWRRDGPRGFYRGMGATVAREAVANAVFFGSYEWAREQLRPAQGRKEDCDALATVAAGAVAGVASWLTVYPLDVVKSHVQMSTERPMPGGWKILRDLAAKGSLITTLYSGLWPTLVKAVPVAGALLYAVEFSKPTIRRAQADVQVWWPKVAETFAQSKDQFSGCDFVSGWIAGKVSSFVGHPLDTVSKIQQVNDENLTKAIQTVYAKDKFKGYYKGLSFPLMTAGISNAVFFGVNGNAKRLLHAYRNKGVDVDDQREDVRLCCHTEHLNRFWHLDVFLSGCIGGVFQMPLTIPIEVVKTTLQLSNISSTPDLVNASGQTKKIPKILGPMKLIVEIYKTRGLSALYRGGSLLVIRDVPSSGLYMLTYEHLCCKLGGIFNLDEFAADKSAKSIPKEVQLISGGLAGVTCWAMVLPIEVIRSKIFADTAEPRKYKGVLDSVMKIYRKGGLKPFFSGFWVISARAFIVNSIMFLTYEMLLKGCNQYNQEEPEDKPIDRAGLKI